ncbi:unnamed protein product [Cylicocyclus nassatus]|uniref:C2H2-type domain-containing protein n=1 Tax=Cylicocyclus nassatus TaxID=53992 RepID=A0AA36GZL9_CYLNA|nr:unnamed protein product [Cylicocyclus nassatus]
MPFMVDVFPTKDEILRNEGDLLCQLCGKRFSNISARRLHTVKTHGILSCESDRRIYEKVRDGCSRTYIYHCPAEPCRKKSLRFNGMRNLKQHYIRVHTPKNILCKCGSAFALRKDLLYHQSKRCLLGERKRKGKKSPTRSTEEYDQPSTSVAAPPPGKKNSNKEARLENESLPQQAKTSAEAMETNSHTIIHPVILVVPTENIAFTVEAIKRVFRTTTEAGVQVHPFDFAPAIEKATVAVGMDQPSCFDFCGQVNSVNAPYFYHAQETGSNTANASSSTEQPMLDFAQSSTFCYEAQQASEQGIQYVYGTDLVTEAQVRNRTTSTSGQYLENVYSTNPQVVAAAQPLVKTFGTMVDEKVCQSNVSSCVRNAETSMDGPEFDLLRDIETQTPWNDVGLMTDFWTDMGHSP